MCLPSKESGFSELISKIYSLPGKDRIWGTQKLKVQVTSLGLECVVQLEIRGFEGGSRIRNRLDVVGLQNLLPSCPPAPRTTVSIFARDQKF